MRKDKKYLVIDTETGGVNNRKHSILEIAGVVWTPGEEPKELFEFLIKENDIIAENEALKINKIDLEQVKKDGLTPIQSVKAIKMFLDDEFGKNRRAVEICGHNVGFDIGFLKRLYSKAGLLHTYRYDFTSRCLDSHTILAFLIDCGILPSVKADSNNLFKLTDVSIPEDKRHRAMGDALATAQALNVLYKKVKVKNNE